MKYLPITNVLIVEAVEATHARRGEDSKLDKRTPLLLTYAILENTGIKNILILKLYTILSLSPSLSLD